MPINPNIGQAAFLNQITTPNPSVAEASARAANELNKYQLEKLRGEAEASLRNMQAKQIGQEMEMTKRRMETLSQLFANTQVPQTGQPSPSPGPYGMEGSPATNPMVSPFPAPGGGGGAMPGMGPTTAGAAPTGLDRLGQAEQAMLQLGDIRGAENLATMRSNEMGMAKAAQEQAYVQNKRMAWAAYRGYNDLQNEQDPQIRALKERTVFQNTGMTKVQAEQMIAEDLQKQEWADNKARRAESQPGRPQDVRDQLAENADAEAYVRANIPYTFRGLTQVRDNEGNIATPNVVAATRQVAIKAFTDALRLVESRVGPWSNVRPGDEVDTAWEAVSKAFHVEKVGDAEFLVSDAAWKRYMNKMPQNMDPDLKKYRGLVQYLLDIDVITPEEALNGPNLEDFTEAEQVQ